jgi:hypothetical protein
MTESTYSMEEVLIERDLNKLYGMAIARSRNKTVLEEARTTFNEVLHLLYRQWNDCDKLRKDNE